MLTLRFLAAVAAVSLGATSPAAAAPAFVPTPKQAFEGFVAINPPRSDVPVGALWIDGYGPTGSGAGKDNLEIVASLNGISMDSGFQLNLSLGILELLGIDPKYRDRFTARFSDLTIVRVKDIAKLAGPPGEPRIIEALKAGSVTVSTDTEAGLAGDTPGWEVRKVDGSGTTGRTRAFSIEGRNMFIAMRVASLERTQGKERQLTLHPAGANLSAVSFDGYNVLIRERSCPDANSACAPAEIAVLRISSHAPTASPEFKPANANEWVRLTLPVPTGDERGGLFDALEVRWNPECRQVSVDGCARTARVVIRFAGTRVADLKSPQARGW